MAAANYLNAQISSRYRRSQLSLNGPSKTLSDGNEPGTPPSEPAADDASPPNANKRRSKDDAAKPAPKRLKTGGKRPTDAKGKHSPPNVRLCDLGGLEAAIEQLLELVAMPLCHPEIYLHTGVRPPRGVLLHGPPGCGKTMLAAAIAGVCPSVRRIRLLDALS
jgi:ribosome biogenesis ATPase